MQIAASDIVLVRKERSLEQCSSDPMSRSPGRGLTFAALALAAVSGLATPCFADTAVASAARRRLERTALERGRASAGHSRGDAPAAEFRRVVCLRTLRSATREADLQPGDRTVATPVSIHQHPTRFQRHHPGAGALARGHRTLDHRGRPDLDFPTAGANAAGQGTWQVGSEWNIQLQITPEIPRLFNRTLFR